MNGVPARAASPLRSVRANFVLWLVIGLPAVAVVASFATLATTILHPESELPEQYHWEGFQLDRDFSRSERATQLGVRAEVVGLARGGTCTLILAIRGAAPERLRLMLAHATLPGRDSRVVLELTQRHDDGRAAYSGDCSASEPGHWRIELSDAQATWSLREAVHGPLDRLSLNAGVFHGD